MFGVHTLAGLVEWRSTHALAKDLRKNLNEEAVCARLFVGQNFSWLEAQPFSIDLTSSGAEFASLTYVNKGSVGQGAKGNHLYRVAFEAAVRDKDSQEVVRFPSFYNHLFEVDGHNVIVSCHPDDLLRFSTSTPAQEVTYKPCETEGWQRRMLCDRGTDRCYPVSQCERRQKGQS